MAEMVHTDLSGYDLTTAEGRIEAFRYWMSFRAEPGKMPSNDIETLQPEAVEFDGISRAVVRFRPQSWQLNGFQYIQGGFLASMIDCVCGPLSEIYSGGKSVGTIDMVTTYFRPVKMDDTEITAEVNLVSNSSRIMHFECSLFNSRNKLAVKVVTKIMKDSKKEV